MEISMSEIKPDIEITIATELTEDLLKACQRLVPQLTTNNPPPSREQLIQMLASPSSILFLARHRDYGEEILGMATLVLYYVPTGLRGYLEDLVVDIRARNIGMGESLLQACLEKAKQAGAPQVMLTSNPIRKTANQLYLRMGFEIRKTNVYRFNLCRIK
jgi:ribosomal protein S18 acetylase RimI-like enzyme